VTVTPMDKKVNTLMTALKSAGPESCRSMLLSVAPIALKVPKDERHVDQDAIFVMLKEIFDAEKTHWQSRVVDATNVCEDAAAQQTEKAALKDAAAAALKSHKDVVHAKMEAQNNADAVVADCKEEVSSATSMREHAKIARDDIANKQTSDLALQDAIKLLKEGSIDNPKEFKKHITAVTALFQSLGAEEALVKTIPQILRRTPEDRSNFDEMALQQLDRYMKDHLDALSSKLDAADQTLAEHETAVTAWQATVQVAEEKKQESDEALDAASAEEAQLQQELNNARKILKDQTAVVKRKNSDLAAEQCGLQNAEEMLETLSFLQEYTTPVPEPEASMQDAKEQEEAEEMPMEAEVAAVSVVPTTKAKEINVAMDFDDVPSPTKRARVSLGGAAPTLVA